MKSSILLLMFTTVKSWGDQGLGKKENPYDTNPETNVIDSKISSWHAMAGQTQRKL